MIILYGLIGSLANWLRGGNLERYWQPPSVWSWKAVNLFICFVLFLFPGGLKYAAGVTIGMAIGQALGWGKELRYIMGADADLVIRGTWGRYVTYPLTKRMDNKKAAWLSMVLRGAFWGLCLAIPTQNIFPVLCGATFPVFYYLAGKVFDKRPWEKAEIGFAFILWASMVI